MRSILVICFLACIPSWANTQALITPFEKDSLSTATYEQSIQFYQLLEKRYPNNVTVKPFGSTDSGKPLHEVVVCKDTRHPLKKFTLVTMINNAIHPGEPDGVDATMIWIREILQSRALKNALDSHTIVIIPFFNVEGVLNRNTNSRSNQNGPKEYGFRGNGKNLDLNRDFIKMDSRNAYSLVQLIRKWDPDVFIDNHVSDGADYPYTTTLLTSMYQQAGTILGDFINEQYSPLIFEEMDAKKDPIVPYVMSHDNPMKGIYGFYDSPRFSTGYTALFRSIGLVPETHMLKPFPTRVRSNIRLLQSIFSVNRRMIANIKKMRSAQLLSDIKTDSLVLWWKQDDTNADSLYFSGYEPKYRKSEVHNGERLYYDRTDTIRQKIPFFNGFKPSLTVAVPESYIIPQAYQEVINRLKVNNIKMNALSKDTVLEVELDRILEFPTTKEPYESHYLHFGTKTEKTKQLKKYYKGDIVINPRQTGIKYIMQCLEPQADDSFFAWNFFDGILMRKEYYSDYVFEDTAANLLKSDSALKQKFDAKLANDPAFAKDNKAQLRFVYENSPYSEPTYRIYPIGRVVRKQ